MSVFYRFFQTRPALLPVSFCFRSGDCELVHCNTIQKSFKSETSHSVRIIIITCIHSIISAESAHLDHRLCEADPQDAEHGDHEDLCNLTDNDDNGEADEDGTMIREWLG